MEEKPKIVEIQWYDVQSFDGGLLNEADLDTIEPVTATIIGYLIRETDNDYYIAKEWWSEGSFKYLHVVPKESAIISIKELTTSEIQQDETREIIIQDLKDRIEKQQSEIETFRRQIQEARGEQQKTEEIDINKLLDEKDEGKKSNK